MNLSILKRKKEFVNANIHLISKAAQENYAAAFEIEYTHNSTAIEGNTLTLMETKLLIEDKLSVGGKDLREIYEVVNHNKAFSYITKKVSDKEPLNEKTIKDIHALLMENLRFISAVRSTHHRHPMKCMSKLKTFIWIWRKKKMWNR